MYCTNCGQKLPDDAKYCSNCGKPVQRPVSDENSGDQSHVPVTPVPAGQESSRVTEKAETEETPVENVTETAVGAGAETDEETAAGTGVGTDAETAAGTGTKTAAESAARSLYPPVEETSDDDEDTRTVYFWGTYYGENNGEEKDPASEQSVNEKPVGGDTAEEKTKEKKPAEEHPAEEHPAEKQHAEGQSAEKQPADQPYVEEQPPEVETAPNYAQPYPQPQNDPESGSRTTHRNGLKYTGGRIDGEDSGTKKNTQTRTENHKGLRILMMVAIIALSAVIVWEIVTIIQINTGDITLTPPELHTFSTISSTEEAGKGSPDSMSNTISQTTEQLSEKGTESAGSGS